MVTEAVLASGARCRPALGLVKHVSECRNAAFVLGFADGGLSSFDRPNPADKSELCDNYTAPNGCYYSTRDHAVHFTPPGVHHVESSMQSNDLGGTLRM